MSKTKLGLGIFIGLTVFAVSVGQVGAIFLPGFGSVPTLPDKAYFGVFHNSNVDLGEVGPFVSSEIIVKFKGDEKPFRVIKIPQGKVGEKMKEYLKRPDVEYAEPNYIAYALAVPNDPYYSYQWHMDNPVYGGIQTEEAWDISTGSGATVAIVDTGIAYENYRQGLTRYYLAPDLANTCFVPGYDFINNDTHPNDDNSHGTHVAGTVAQSTNNGVGVAGVAFNSCLMPVKVLNKNGSGTYTQVANGIYWAVDHGTQVINLSLGGSSPSDTLKNAVAYAYNNGVTVIAACGNDSTPSCAYPAAYDDYVIAVGATRYDETLSYYSSYGPSLDLVAPGGDLNVDQNGDGYGDGVLQNTFNPNTKNTSDFGYWFFQGTSMAAPHVSGTAALLIAKGNATTPDQVRTALQKTAEDKGTAGWDQTYGWGLVDAYAALQWTAGPECEVGQTRPCGETDVGECEYGTQTCTAEGVWGECIGAIYPTNEICDGLDNDCDGLIDENLGQTTCGVGACEVTIDNCVNGEPQTCIPGTPTEEICDGIDNDCDGLIDEDGVCGAVKCWSADYGYLYRSNGQAKKFCKCASGIYGYSRYKYNRSIKTVYKYIDTTDDTDWDVTSLSSYGPIYSVTCNDGKAYPTNGDYYYGQ